MNVLIISDEVDSSELLTVIFRQAGLLAVTTHRTDAEGGLSATAKQVPDLIVIDVAGAGFDPLGLCRTLRSETIVPIVVTSPRGEEEEVLRLYEAGIDEFLNKPVSPRILVAKAKALLRRARSLPLASVSSLEAHGVQLDPERRAARLGDGSEINLTNLEFRLLYCLMSNQGRVVPTETIVERVWGYSGESDSRLVKGLVRRLRRRIEPDRKEPRYIKTVPGVGYAFSAAEE
jgi:two-component system response regulator MtrA